MEIISREREREMANGTRERNFERILFRQFNSVDLIRFLFCVEYLYYRIPTIGCFSDFLLIFNFGTIK